MEASALVVQTIFRHTLNLFASARGASQQQGAALGRYEIGGFHQLSGYRDGQLLGNYVLFLRLSWYVGLSDAPLLTRSFVVGATVEAGNAYASRYALRAESLRGWHERVRRRRHGAGATLPRPDPRASRADGRGSVHLQALTDTLGQFWRKEFTLRAAHTSCTASGKSRFVRNPVHGLQANTSSASPGDLKMTPQLQARADGAVSCSEGWAVRFVAPDLLEYSQGQAACLVNVGGGAPSQRERRIYASESSSELFPLLREHLQSAIHHFKGQYVVV